MSDKEQATAVQLLQAALTALTDETMPAEERRATVKQIAAFLGHGAARIPESHGQRRTA